jgi:CelD/BcsL family acetyltransferase involved in cellulose biosynthesis
VEKIGEDDRNCEDEMHVHLVETADPEWTGRLPGTDYDIFQLPEYLRVEDVFRGTTTRLLVVEEGTTVMLLPLVFSSLEDGAKDASSPFRHAGPVFSTTADSGWRRRAVSAALEHLREEGVVSLFLRALPLVGLEDFASFGTVVEHGPTYVIPLDRPLEEIMAGMRQGHRRNMRKAARDGLVAEPDPDWNHLLDVHAIYSQTMDRLEARPAYRFDREYFEGLRDAVRDHTSLWVLKMDGEVAGAHVVTECNGTVQYLLGATHPAFHRRVPQVAIFDAVLQWAHARGNANYFLGGGVQESLLHFKAGFTRVQRPAATARIIVDPGKYRRLCERWEAIHDRPAEGAAAFFPAYRAPSAVAA